MSRYALLTISAIALLSSVVAGDFTLPVKTCKRGSDDYSSCLRLAIQEALPAFVKGIPELDFPALDPFYTKEQHDEYRNGEILGNFLVYDAYTYGLAKARIKAVRPVFEGDNFRLEVDYESPKFFSEGKYKADGRIGSFKLGGEGYFNLSAEDVSVTWKIEGKVVDDHWKVEHFHVSPQLGKLKVYFSNLFNGNDELNKAAMQFVNEYWPSLTQSVLPIASKSWDKVCTELANRIFSKVPFSKVFP